MPGRYRLAMTCDKLPKAQTCTSPKYMGPKILTLPISPFKVTQGHWNQHRSIDQPWLPISIVSTYVPPVSSVRALGVHINSDVSLWTHVTATVRSCFAALRQIRNAQRCLPQHALLTLISALVVSMVHYCCSVLAGVSGHLPDRLQSILNTAARLVFSARR